MFSRICSGGLKANCNATVAMTNRSDLLLASRYALAVNKLDNAHACGRLQHLSVEAAVNSVLRIPIYNHLRA